MANTVTSLSYANTFGHWLTATSALIAENNTLAKDNYVKDSGTIYLSEGTLNALQSNGNVIVQKILSVQGVGSSAIVQNDLTVQRQGLFTNTELSLVASGSANVANVLNVLGSGFGLRVANNARVGGDLYVGGNLDLNILEARQKVNTETLSVTGATYTSRLQSNNQVVTNILTANSNIFTSRLQSNTSITTTEIQANTVINAATISITTGIFGNSLQANSSVNTSNASIVHTLHTNRLQANSSVNTSNVTVVNTVLANNIVANSTITVPNAYVSSNVYVTENIFVTDSTYAYDTYTQNTAYTDLFFANTAYILRDATVSGNVVATSLTGSSNVTTSTLHSINSFGDYLTANLHIYTPSIDVEGTTLTRFVQANSSMNTSNSSVVNTSWTKNLIANTLITTAAIAVTGKTHTNTLQANTSANTETLSVTQRALIEQVQANTSVNTEILSVSTTALANRLEANSIVFTPLLNVTANTFTNRLQSNVSVNTATMSVTQKIDANNASVFVNNLQTIGQLSVGGDFVINGTTIYNSNVFTLNASSNEGQFASISINRGVTGANAEIFWNESQEWWEVYGVHTGDYYRILTNEHLSDALDSTNPLVIASSLAANTLDAKIQTANNYFTSVTNSTNTFANGAFVRANSSYAAQNTTASFANASFRHANAAYESANNVAPQVAPSFAQANAAFEKANSVISSIRGTTGSISANGAGITLKSNNGIVIFATNDNGTGNTLSISTSQDLTTTGSPTFAAISLTTPLQVGQGGTGTSSYASLFGLTVTAAAGSGAAGKVLGTDGAGGYSWVTGGTGEGGGGTQPGSRISSSRLSYTGDSLTTKFTTPTFSVGTQLRTYINGVRQLESEYNAFTSNSIVQFTSAPVTGDKILVEVDGYAVYEYFANNIVYGPASGDMVGTTIQDAIDNLETRKMPIIGGTFTGRVNGLTMPINLGSNTVFATTAYVTNHANSGYTLTHSITGNAGTVTNGLYSSSSYANPIWLTSLATSKLSGIISDTNLNNSGVGATGYGTASSVPKFNVDAKGRITSASNVAIQIATSQITGYPTFATSATTDTTNASNITSGTLADARLPSGLAKLSGAAFTGDTSVSGTGKILLNGTGDIYAYRSGDTTGVVFLNKAGNRYLYNDGTNYEMPLGNLKVNNSLVLTEARGGTVTGAINYQSGGAVGTIGQSGTLAVYGNGGAIATNHATMSFHRPGAYAINMGLDNDNAFRIGGWSDNTAGTTPYYRMTLDSVGNATFRNNVTAYSDVRLKTNIETIPNALETVLKMRGVFYDRIDTGEKGVGVIAQEMKEVLPQVVMEAATDEEFMSVSYGNIVGVLIEAIKELKAEIEELKGQNK